MSLVPQGPTSQYHHLTARISVYEFSGHTNISDYNREEGSKDNEERIISMGKKEGETKRTVNGEGCGKNDD